MEEKEFYYKMGQRIYARRKALKMTQEELAEKMDVSTQMISNLELGKKAIRPDNLSKLCSVLGLSADYVLSGKTINSNVESVADELLHLNDEEIKIIAQMVRYMAKRQS